MFVLLMGMILGLSSLATSILGVAIGLILVVYRQKWGLLVALGVVFGQYVGHLHSGEGQLPSGNFKGSIGITSFPEYRRGKTVCAGLVDDAKCVLKFEGVQSFGPGDRIFITGLNRLGVEANLTVFSWVRSEVGPFTALSDARIFAIRRLEKLYGVDDASWVSALTFNYPSEMSRDDKNALLNSGTYHLVSASGLHVWVVALIVQYLLLMLTVPRHWQIFLTGLVLIAYCCLTGFHSPTVRSALMWFCLASAYLFRRSPDALSALSFSGLIWLAFEPGDILTASFQLSYIITGFLVIWFEQRRRANVAEALNGLESSFVASIAAEPLAAWWFGRLVLIGPIANVFVGFMSSCILVAGVVTLIPIVGELLVPIVKAMVWVMREATYVVAQFPVMTFTPRSIPPVWLLAYFGLLVLVLMGRRPKVGDPLASL
jgi:ComEC/Rec2-related protein